MTNPFSTKYWASGAIPFQFAEQEATLDTLLKQAYQRSFWQIVGPHGSGKSTLLLSLLKQYKKNGSDVCYLLFNYQQSRIPNNLTLSKDQILLIDGFEQLPLRNRLKLLLRSKRLILTVHYPVWFVPILYRTQPQFSVFVQLVRQLVPDPPEESTLRAVFDRSNRNFRTAFFELYDCWEREQWEKQQEERRKELY